LKADRYASRDGKRWTETEELALENILARAIEEVCRHFIEAHKRRVQEAIEWEKQRVESEARHKNGRKKKLFANAKNENGNTKLQSWPQCSIEKMICSKHQSGGEFIRPWKPSLRNANGVGGVINAAR
jgi:hypothetical protein